MNKEEIRRKLKIKRKYLGEIVRLEADRAIAEAFLQAFGGHDSFFVYNSFKDEARTDIIISALLDADKRVYLPRVEGESLAAVPFGRTTPVMRGAFGVEEPCGEAFAGVAQITVVPLLAVNSRGFRIGYGGGYYDRYLKDNPTLKVGLGYDFQFEEFEEEEFDQPLDIYVSERGIYYFGKKQRQ